MDPAASMRNEDDDDDGPAMGHEPCIETCNFGEAFMRGEMKIFYTSEIENFRGMGDRVIGDQGRYASPKAHMQTEHLRSANTITE